MCVCVFSLSGSSSLFNDLSPYCWNGVFVRVALQAYGTHTARVCEQHTRIFYKIFICPMFLCVCVCMTVCICGAGHACACVCVFMCVFVPVCVFVCVLMQCSRAVTLLPACLCDSG